MDGNRFDQLTRSLGTANTRRAFLRSALGVAATGLLGSLGLQGSSAARTATPFTSFQSDPDDGQITVREAVGDERQQLIEGANSNAAFNLLALHLQQQELLGASGGTATLVMEQSGAVLRKVVLVGYKPRLDLSLVESLVAILKAILARILGGPELGGTDEGLLAFGIEANGSAGSYATLFDQGEPWYFLTAKNNQVQKTALYNEAGDAGPMSDSIRAWSSRPSASPRALRQEQNCSACEGMCGLIFDLAAPKQSALEIGFCLQVPMLTCSFAVPSAACTVSSFFECQRILGATLGLPEKLGCGGLCRSVDGGCVEVCEPQSCTGGQYFDQERCKCLCPLTQSEPVLCGGQCVSSACDTGSVFDEASCQCVTTALPCDPGCDSGQVCINGGCFDGCAGDSSQCGEFIQCFCPSSAEGIGVCVNTVEAQFRPDCGSTGDCPTGFVCAANGGGVFQCLPPCAGYGGIPRDPCDEVDCSWLSDACNDGVCDSNGQCNSLPKPEGTSCTTGEGASGGCQQGACIGDPVSSTYTVTVRGIEPWTDTSIDVSVGDKVDLTASGTIRNNAGNPNISPDGQYADGYGPIAPCPYVVPLPTTACWSLIARLDEGSPFAVGSGASFTATSSGRLFLGVNDEFFADNSGAWTVDVTTTTAP